MRHHLSQLGRIHSLEDLKFEILSLVEQTSWNEHFRKTVPVKAQALNLKIFYQMHRTALAYVLHFLLKAIKYLPQIRCLTFEFIDYEPKRVRFSFCRVVVIFVPDVKPFYHYVERA